MNDNHDALIGLSPARPPAALRAHVLAAARHAATQPALGLLEALYRDHLLRACAAGLAALVIANAIATGGGRAEAPVAATAFAVNEDTAIPGDTELTAAEQLDELAPILGDAYARRRG
jgi:hypothetical protein